MDKRLIIILLASILVFGANVWGTSIYVLDEAKNSGCAMEMAQRHDWIVPTFNDKLRTDKPPLHYFFMRLSYQLFDFNPFSARLFSVIMGVLTILLVCLFTSIIINKKTAFLSALILISSIQLAIQFHLAVPDPYLIFFLTTGLLSFYYAFITDKAKFFYLSYICISLATLAKGPVAILFYALIILIFLIVMKAFSWQGIKRMKILYGILIFFVLVMPWYVAVGIETDGVWLDQFLFKHNIGRFTSSMEGHRGFPLASFVILVVAMMPFSFFFPQMVKQVWREKKEKPFLLFCFIVVLVVVLFFAFSKTILPNYPEPALPFFGILLGSFFHDLVENKNERRIWIPAFVYSIIAIALPFITWFVLHQDKNLNDISNVAVYFILFPLGALVGLYFILTNRVLFCFYSYVVSHFIFLLVFFYVVFPKVDVRNPVVKSLPILKQSTKPIYYYRDFNPAYIMALKRTIPELDKDQIPEDVYVISQKKYLQELNELGFKLVFESQDLFEKPVTIIVSK